MPEPSPEVPPGQGGSQSLPRRFADYDLLEEVARGGMGVVYRARQISLDRIVAVKRLLDGALSSSEFVRRFRLEAAAAGGLQHPNIVAIHEVGLQDGQHFIAMDYVDGPNLATVIAQGPLPARRAASYVKTVAEAIEYAHSQGILHRDLKPSNILLDSHDQPRVTDFGLAKKLDSDVDLTVTGQVLGSPNYMPPEQASGHRGNLNRTADVYSLGAVLYHLVTGRPPFQAATMATTLEQVRTAEPISPRRLNPGLPRDLETICLKCLEKEPERRYPTAQALADELDRFLESEPIQARPIGALSKTWRWCRRKPLVASLCATTVAAILVGLMVSLVGFASARKEAQAALRSAQKSNRLVELMQELISSAEPSFGEGKEPTVRDMLNGFCRTLDERLANEPEVEARLRTYLGSTFIERFQQGAASNQLFRALALVGTRLPDDSLEAALIHQAIGEYYLVNEMTDDAQRHLARANDIFERGLPSDDFLLLKTKMQLAMCHRDTGDYTVAHHLLREVVESTRRKSGESVFDNLRANAIRFLADICRVENRFSEARDWIAEWRQAASLHHAPNHPLLLLADFQEARGFRDQARVTGNTQLFAKAIEEFDRVLQIQSQAMPKDHGDILETRLELATTHFQAGHTHEAVRGILEVYRTVSRKMGSDHAMTRRVLAVMREIHQKTANEELGTILQDTSPNPAP